MMKNETGRTLMEMLGVIVLMGVLTMGSVTLFRDATAKMRLNNLLDEVRKRALVSNEKSSKFTYGMFNDNGSGSASPITAYGYGVGDNNTGVIRGKMQGYAVAIVPAGGINGGKALEKNVCEKLLSSVYDPSSGNKPITGGVMGVFEYQSGKCITRELSDCGSDNPDEGKSTPSVVCIAIKS